MPKYKGAVDKFALVELFDGTVRVISTHVTRGAVATCKYNILKEEPEAILICLPMEQVPTAIRGEIR